jgi:hypothetical protein
MTRTTPKGLTRARSDAPIVRVVIVAPNVKEADIQRRAHCFAESCAPAPDRLPCSGGEAAGEDGTALKFSARRLAT